MSQISKQRLKVLENHLDEIPAELILKFAFLCSSCGQSVNTKECDEESSSHWCCHHYDSDKDEDIYFDLGGQVCSDCSMACLHCDEKVICEECYESWGECGEPEYPAGDEMMGLVHDDFVCYQCESKWVHQENRYHMYCTICEAEHGKCSLCSSRESILTHKKFANLHLCKECYQAFQ